MFSVSFFQIIVLFLLIFLIFGDLNKIKENFLKIKEFLKKFLE